MSYLLAQRFLRYYNFDDEYRYVQYKQLLPCNSVMNDHLKFEGQDLYQLDNELKDH